MNLTDYIQSTRDTKKYPDDTLLDALSYCSLGLCGEAGEAVDCVKKMLRFPDDAEHQLVQSAKLYDELGDVFYYLIRLMEEAGYTVEDVLQRNHDKRMKRVSEGTLLKR